MMILKTAKVIIFWSLELEFLTTNLLFATALGISISLFTYERVSDRAQVMLQRRVSSVFGVIAFTDTLQQYSL